MEYGKGRIDVRKNKNAIRYTIGFIVLYSVLYLLYKTSETSFLWTTEKQSAYYSTFYYIGDYLKNMLKDIVGIGTVRPGAFDFRIGQGMDVLTTLNGYGLGDPINLLTLLISQNYMEWFYKTLLILRLYVAGAAALLYLYKIGLKETKYLLTGALSYTLLGAVLFYWIGHPLLLSALIYLPLLLMAIERFIRKNKYGCFIVMIGVSFISSIYFACINTILVAAYVIVRIYFIKKQSGQKGLRTMLTLGITYLWGMATAAVVLLPVGYAFLETTPQDLWNRKIKESLKESPVQAMTTIKDASFYRVEQPFITSNQSLLLKYNGTTFCYSMVPKIMSKYYENLAVASLERPNECNGQDSRVVLNELSSTKYYVTDSKRKGLVPYGYEATTSKKREDGTKDIVYENKYALGIGYTYLFVMRQSEYEALSPLERQEALMTCAIIPDEEMTDDLLATGKELTREKIKFSTHEIYSKFGKINGLKMKKKEDGKTTIKVLKKNATLEINYNGEEDSETYLLIKQFQAEQGEDYNKLTIISGKNVQTAMALYNKTSASYYEKEYYGVNLGSGKDSKKSVIITFPTPGTFSFESLGIYSYPLKKYTAQALSLRDGELQNVSVAGSTISGTTELENAGWMQFSIPYSKGWSAFVDGKEEALTVSDTMYMGLYLEEGAHKILLTYRTPYLVLGFIITMAAILGLVISYLIREKRN